MLTRLVLAALKFGGYTPVYSTAPPPTHGDPAAAPAPVPAIPAPLREIGLHTACVRYAQAIENRTWDDKWPADRERILNAMGPDLAAWQRVLQLTRRPPWRAGESMTAAAALALARRAWTTDLDAWESALRALDSQAAIAASLAWNPPAPLHLPVEVANALAARRRAALERARQRARRGAAETQGAPVTLPDEDVSPPLGPRR